MGNLFSGPGISQILTRTTTTISYSKLRSQDKELEFISLSSNVTENKPSLPSDHGLSHLPSQSPQPPPLSLPDQIEAEVALTPDSSSQPGRVSLGPNKERPSHAMESSKNSRPPTSPRPSQPSKDQASLLRFSARCKRAKQYLLRLMRKSTPRGSARRNSMERRARNPPFPVAAIKTSFSRSPTGNTTGVPVNTAATPGEEQKYLLEGARPRTRKASEASGKVQSEDLLTSIGPIRSKMHLPQGTHESFYNHPSATIPSAAFHYDSTELLPPEIPPRILRTMKKAMEIIDPPLEEWPWFHGALSQNQASQLVLAKGARGHGYFLIRESESRSGKYILTINIHGKAKHIVVTLDDFGNCQLKGLRFQTIFLMLEYFSVNPIPLNSEHCSDAILTNYVSRRC